MQFGKCPVISNAGSFHSHLLTHLLVHYWAGLHYYILHNWAPAQMLTIIQNHSGYTNVEAVRMFKLNYWANSPPLPPSFTFPFLKYFPTEYKNFDGIFSNSLQASALYSPFFRHKFSWHSYAFVERFSGLFENLWTASRSQLKHQYILSRYYASIAEPCLWYSMLHAWCSFRYEISKLQSTIFGKHF